MTRLLHKEFLQEMVIETLSLLDYHLYKTVS